MYDRILLATDGRTNTRAAIGYAVDVARRDDARLDAVYVNQPRSIFPRSSWSTAPTASADATVPPESFRSMVTTEVRAHSIEGTVDVRAGHLTEVVPSHVHEEAVDHVVINRTDHRTLFNRITAGGRGKLARQLDVPVTFVGDPTPEPEEDPSAGQVAHSHSATIE